ncbi:hypothetical protein MHU86_6078 [Fragilaria crotonensis]|nr:hypothetical protein MHU86_6078 [Fragilaria crotonensis]
MFEYKFLPSSEINTAPWVFTSELELDISIDECWSIITDDRAWQHWHPQVTNIQNDKEPAGGAGNSRTIVFRHWFFMALLAGPIAIREEFDVWEDQDDAVKKYQFWLAAASRPVFLTYKGGREEFKVESISATMCKFTRVVALQPAFLPRYALGWLVCPVLRRLFTVQCPQRLTEAIAKNLLPIIK